MRERTRPPLSPRRPGARPGPAHPARSGSPVRLPLRLLALVAALGLLGACQDAAGVGLGLIDEEGVDPSVRTLAATSVDTALVDRTSIGFSDSSATLPQTRVLAGIVTDPLFGTARAVGYIDFIRPAVPSTTEPENVLSARLEIQRTYVYGDTTTSLSVGLRQVEGGWSPTSSYPADTLFDVGPVLAMSSVSVADSVLAFDLPQSWVEANAAALLSDTFGEDFEGFALEPSTPGGAGAVFGFQTQTFRTRLQVFTTADTLTYSVGEVFSSVEREEPAALPFGISPAQVTSGRAVALRFALDTVGSLPLARAVLRAPIDASLRLDGSFLRPVAERALLYGIGADGTRTLISPVTVADGVASTSLSNTLTPVLQDVLVGDLEFVRYELEPVGVPASLDILPVLLRDAGGEPAPTLSLTLVGS